MRILNLFAGIGGNRTLWGDNHQITAVELDPIIVEIYKKRFPNDTIIVGDAYAYAEEHYQEFDFIWASPPCQTHSCLMYRSNAKKRLPDFQLYALIFFLKQWCKCDWVVENVKVIDEMIEHDVKIGRHLIWTNLKLENRNIPKKYEIPSYIGSDGKKHTGGLSDLSIDTLLKIHKIPFNFKHPNKKSILRNCVDYEIGEYVLNKVLEDKKEVKKGLLKY